MQRIPSADKIDAVQIVSPKRAGKNNNPPILVPYLIWNGSSMVT